METVNKNNFEETLDKATTTLLELVKVSCWNTISDNTVYIISEIQDEIPNRKKRININSKKKTKSLKEVSSDLTSIFEDLYDISLYVFKSKRNKTIIEIQYYLKSALPKEFYKTVKGNNPMLHCKISIPFYRLNSKRKFDVNWEHSGIRHKWNSFIDNFKVKLWRFNNLN